MTLLWTYVPGEAEVAEQYFQGWDNFGGQGRELDVGFEQIRIAISSSAFAFSLAEQSLAIERRVLSGQPLYAAASPTAR